MQQITKLILIFSVALILSSCEEVVDINLKASEPKVVIDAWITENHPCMVFITKSQAFNNNDPYLRIPGVTVELSDDFGHRETLRESRKEAGLYIGQMTGVANQSYHLKISVDGQDFEAKSTIPKAVPIDSIYIYSIKRGSELWYSPCIIFKDPPDTENYYYNTVSVNDKTLKSIYLNNDEHRNGLEIQRILFFDKEDNNDENLKIGDQIRVEMQTLDKGMFVFYQSLYSVAAGGSTNPITNFSGGALGCFKAYNSSSKEITISKDHIYSEK